MGFTKIRRPARAFLADRESVGDRNRLRNRSTGRGDMHLSVEEARDLANELKVSATETAKWLDKRRAKKAAAEERKHAIQETIMVQS